MFKSVYKHLVDIALGKTSEEHLQFPPDSHFWLLEAGRTMGDQPPSKQILQRVCISMPTMA